MNGEILVVSCRAITPAPEGKRKRVRQTVEITKGVWTGATTVAQGRKGVNSSYRAVLSAW